MGTEEPQLITLVSNLWDSESRVFDAENAMFALSFSP
jgi:hypothetical protein